MAWVMANPEIHSIFESLGHQTGDFFQINGDCCEKLELILNNILTEDKSLRTFRRNISFGQNIKKDLIPLLIHATEDKIIHLLIRILFNLTVPVEYLLSTEVVSRTDIGRHIIFELNNLLKSCKEVFADCRTTKVFVDYLKRILGNENTKLSAEQCLIISDCLLFLRNVLHVTEENFTLTGSTTSHCPVQNQIVWNLFGQSINKILIQLMASPQVAIWSVTLVQLIALLYKDQHVGNLQKLLNGWLETTLSQSSEDNESNTSPPNRRSEDSSPMLTSDPTSDSSDGGNCKNSDTYDDQNAEVTPKESSKDGQDLLKISTKMFPPSPPVKSSTLQKNMETEEREETPSDKLAANDSNESPPLDPNKAHGETSSNGSDQNCSKAKRKCQSTISDHSDCGYVTQIENQESISTSSNDDDLPAQKPVHQKPHNPKQRANTKTRTNATPQEKKDKRKKKLVRRSRPYIISLKGRIHYVPNDEDITNVLKEFTVDFMLKGYDPLVQALHQQLLHNDKRQIDTSQFFWLITYFLKFAPQLELEMHQISKVLCFDIISYLTSEGVNLCEQLEIAIKTTDADVKPYIRRTHLVVTAIREFVQTMEMYKKASYLATEDREHLVELQVHICQSDELRCLLLLLLRHYSPKYHDKQYLKDLIVTNHTLLLFLDNVMKMPEYHGSTNMLDHVKQFATVDVMHQYGYMLENFANNGEFLNDCVFTIMHHVAGDLDYIQALYQPIILKSFSAIRKTEFEVCDDWSDLIEYVINSFVKNPHLLKKHSSGAADASYRTECDRRQPHDRDTDRADTASASCTEDNSSTNVRPSTPHAHCENFHEDDMWDESDESSLKHRYVKSQQSSDPIDDIVKRYSSDGVFKTRVTVIRQLHKQDIIDEQLYISYMKKEGVEISSHFNNEAQSNIRYSDGHLPSHNENERTRCFLNSKEINVMCQEMINDKKIESLQWLQKVLLDCCFIKITVLKKKMNYDVEKTETEEGEAKKKVKDIMAPVTYHKILSRLSIPLVPWSCWQSAACRDMRFLQLLHRLGLHLPIDSGELFIRIPNFWSVDLLFEVAAKLLPIDISTLKFSIDDISPASAMSAMRTTPKTSESLGIERDSLLNPYRVHRLKQVTDIVQFTPFAALVESTHVMTTSTVTPTIVMGPPLPVGPPPPMRLPGVMGLPRPHIEGLPRPISRPPLIRPTPLPIISPSQHMPACNRIGPLHATIPMPVMGPPSVIVSPHVKCSKPSTKASNIMSSTHITVTSSTMGSSHSMGPSRLIQHTMCAPLAMGSRYSMFPPSSTSSTYPPVTLSHVSTSPLPPTGILNPVFIPHTTASTHLMTPQHVISSPDDEMEASHSMGQTMVPIKGVGLSHSMSSLHAMEILHVSHTRIQHSFIGLASEDDSDGDTDSVASDLTRMYVSDEEDSPDVIPRGFK